MSAGTTESCTKLMSKGGHVRVVRDHTTGRGEEIEENRSATSRACHAMDDLRLINCNLIETREVQRYYQDL